jgi:hypothetical protein
MKNAKPNHIRLREGVQFNATIKSSIDADKDKAEMSFQPMGVAVESTLPGHNKILVPYAMIQFVAYTDGKGE